jgi:hypothetical protein
MDLIRALSNIKLNDNNDSYDVIILQLLLSYNTVNEDRIKQADLRSQFIWH